MTNPKPDALTSIQVALSDLNGVSRGKRVPGDQVDKVMSGALRLPLSVTTVDIWGRDIEENEMVFEQGDGDGICQPYSDAVIAAPWLGAKAGIIPIWMFGEDGTPSATDPRQALARVMDRFAAAKLTPVVATELEFYLTPMDGTDASFPAEGVLSLQQLNEVAPLLDDIYAVCADMGIPADAAISECGPGQFEINLLHRDSALQAADDAVMFKTIVKGYARQHGYTANFMAKPDGQNAGNGLHVHFSLLDANGNNVFDDGTEDGSATLKSAVAGVLDAMAESALIFAPHFNSYRRLQPDSHAPTAICWGYENRTSSVRIPGGSPKARRIEHRVSGADANPYLVLAAVLGAALIGIEKSMTPPAPVDGNSYSADVSQLSCDWASAIKAFEDGPTIAQIFDPQLREIFSSMKRQEMARFFQEVTRFELTTYAEHV